MSLESQANLEGYFDQQDPSNKIIHFVKTRLLQMLHTF